MKAQRVQSLTLIVPPLAGEGGGASHQRGNVGVVPEVYDSLFFSSYLSFPLEGKSREAGKGVRGRAPIDRIRIS